MAGARSGDQVPRWLGSRGRSAAWVGGETGERINSYASYAPELVLSTGCRAFLNRLIPHQYHSLSRPWIHCWSGADGVQRAPLGLGVKYPHQAEAPA